MPEVHFEPFSSHTPNAPAAVPGAPHHRSDGMTDPMLPCISHHPAQYLTKTTTAVMILLTSILPGRPRSSRSATSWLLVGGHTRCNVQQRRCDACVGEVQ